MKRARPKFSTFLPRRKLRRSKGIWRPGDGRREGQSEPLVYLLPYQRKWLADESRFKIAMVARQCGKTKYMAALEVVEDVLRHESRGEKARWIILSRGERQALEAMEEGIRPWCASYGAAVEALEYDFEGSSGISYKAHEVRFRHGSRIT
ncbi:MAG: hypothetical protein Q7S58_21000, partial [Candidatus Binatus sp.]|nr:hypothetical protein [Candidatus Binatus sp.]